MLSIKNNFWILFWSAIYLCISAVLLWNKQEYLVLFPIGLVALYIAVVKTEIAFLGLAFLTPLSVNIEEYSNSFGLFIPTEPLLFGFLVLLVLQQLRSNILPSSFWRSPIVWTVFIYLLWMFFSAVLSTMPVASFKFLLARLWLIIPMLGMGSVFFSKEKNRSNFMWLLCVGMTLVIMYTLVIHASYGFGEKEGHWVMFPFYKDHTIYGMAIALVVPMIFGLYFYKKHSELVQAVLLVLIGIILLGLFFSYTRGAWLSVVAAIGVMLLIHFKIKFQWLLMIAGAVLVGIVLSWTQIEQSLARNKYEHTTEDFGERIQSAANVSTDASNLERLNRWQCAIDMFLEKPIAGFGPGTYAFEYARFQRPENLTIISTNFGDGGNAHSEYLGSLAEMGIFGLLAFLAVVAAIFYQSITLYNKWPVEDRRNRVLLMSIILSLTTYFVHGFLNNYLDTDKGAVPIWGMCAMIIAMEGYWQKNYKIK